MEKSFNMKRSEMIKIIKDTLEANGYSESSISAEEMANVIMYKIEEEGMLPPANELTKNGRMFGDDYDYLYWESENED